MKAFLQAAEGAGQIVDTHCHLGLYPDIGAVLERCNKEAVGVVVSSTRPSEYRSLLGVLADTPGLEIGLGMHPEVAGSVYEPYEFEIFERYVSDAKWISEIGMDGGIAESVGPLFGAVPSRASQSELLERVLGRLNESHCVSVHSRLAEAEVLDQIESSAVRRAVLHNFMGDKPAVHRALDMGLYFSINPWMFMADNTRDLIRSLPLSRILLETDGPFSRWENRPTEPGDCAAIADAIGEIRGESVSLVRDAVAANFSHFWL